MHEPSHWRAASFLYLSCGGIMHRGSSPCGLFPDCFDAQMADPQPFCLFWHRDGRQSSLGENVSRAFHTLAFGSTAFWTAIVAILGTTISPYLFFWQASQEAEEIAATPVREPLNHSPHQASSAFERIRFDTYAGMAFSNLVGFAIIVTTAATLHAQGITNVETSSQAAEALRPIAGRFAFAVFALGIIGTGLLAVPVLAGSAAYAR
jgi:Mn2+/Fe2+ NRAMP family transporter